MVDEHDGVLVALSIKIKILADSSACPTQKAHVIDAKFPLN